MPIVLHNALRRCVYRLTRPLSRVLMQHGMAWGDFMEAARKAWVDEAFCQRQLTGKRATISSVSALTGLTRRETSRIRGEPIEGDSERDARYNRAARVVSGWVSDRRFHDASGEPRDLPMDAADGFADLVRTYSGDIPTVAMLRLLEASGTVTVEASMVRLAQRAYIDRIGAGLWRRGRRSRCRRSDATGRQWRYRWQRSREQRRHHGNRQHFRQRRTLRD
jgi:hypothetical protein